MLIIWESALWCLSPNYALTQEEFWRNSRGHLAAQVKQHRNHPSIVIWSAENELLLCGGDQIDGPPVGEGQPGRAFRVYRSGVPDKETFARWCSVYKIERAIVMSGSAEKNELAYQKEGICPDIEVVYNVLQNHAAPVSVLRRQSATSSDSYGGAARSSSVMMMITSGRPSAALDPV